MMRRNQRHRAFDPDPAAPDRHCDIPGCPERAGYRAPRSRQTLTDYFWFCLDHVREYNSRWDYYKGMSPGQIEAHLRADVSWNRPSWRLGHLGGGAPLDEEQVLDPLGVLRGNADARVRGRRRAREKVDHRPEALRQPLETLGLGWPVSLQEVKTRYKDLARRHHPDANGGDRAAEERLKTINVAYTALRVHLTEARQTSLAETG
ncbi:J domain-containing protein [Lichenicola cladoniae]|uniref:J domain-containing protein n=2 Tax=Lichenicola cladoniae TaxID=1484109 RepID=A0A6M8HN49_9PROT|nr:J domain-containing protein [Acetobacteraceae bacterium]QKE89731.1 J domain-containing protein [Lichenicola cladoniae]